MSQIMTYFLEHLVCMRVSKHLYAIIHC